MPPPMPPVTAPPSNCNCSEVQAELETKLKDMEERLANETKLHAAELANETKLRAAELKAMEERTEAALEAIRQFILMTPPSTPPPLPSPPPPQRPVECGRAGVCSETPGLRDPNELHEVRACTQPNPSHACALYMRLLTARAPTLSWPGAVLLQRQALSSLGIPSAWLLCVGGVICGLAVHTRPDLRPGRGHLPSRRREALHRCGARGRLHRRHWVWPRP